MGINFEGYNDLKISDDLVSQGGTFRDVRVSGDGTIDGDINCRSMRISGDGEVRGKVYCDEDLKISGDVECGGLVNGDEVYINMYGSHNITEIGGRIIRVSDDIGKVLKFALKFGVGNKAGSGLNCQCIEGDDIMLKNSKVQIIRGHNIILGKGCIVDKVEYTGELTVLEDAIVREKVIIK